MDFQNSFEIDAPRQRVWEAMFDADVVRQVLPGCRQLVKTGATSFDVTMAAGIGVLRGVFKGSVEFSELVEPASSALTIKAQGSLGRVSGSGALSLDEHGTGTILGYRASFAFGGPMAGLGEGLMRSVADALVRDALNRFRKQVAAGQQPVR
jgi:carbon monoxide dehydrogenase subunit G